MQIRVLFFLAGFCCLGLINGCFESQPNALENPVLQIQERADLIFNRSGLFEYGEENLRLGEPISRWVEVFGKPSRVEDNRLYIWDQIGMKVFTVRSSHISESAAPSDMTNSFAVHFVHWPTYDPVLVSPDDPGGLPLGFFPGVFEYGGVQIDRDTSIQEFVAINDLNDSPSRPHDYRHLIEDSDPRLYFSISPKGTEDGPYKPKSLDISIWD